MAASKPYPSFNGPKIVGHMLASQTHEFVLRLEQLGFTFGQDGAVLNPELQPIVDGLYHALAGGEVEIKVKHRGNPDIVTELQTRQASATAESNQLNQDVGFYLGVTV